MLLFDVESEVKFIYDLMIVEKLGELVIWFGGKLFYLMRNVVCKDKGLGFVLVGNFYFDFLLWVVDYVNGK